MRVFIVPAIVLLILSAVAYEIQPARHDHHACPFCVDGLH